MSKFTGPLIIEEIKPGVLWRLRAPIEFEVDSEGSGRTIKVPEQFVTDGASIPRFLRVFLAVWGTYGRAAALHDYLYSLIRSKTPNEYAFDRRACDNVFFDAMSACGTSPPLKYLLWLAVRTFGWYSIKYRKNRE